MQKEGIGDMRKLAEDTVVFDEHGPAGKISARHNQGEGKAPQKEVMKARIGEHDAHSVETRRYRGRQIPGFMQEDDDGAPGRAQKLPFLFGRLREKGNLVLPGHEGEGLRRPSEPSAELRHHAFPRGVAGKMRPA